MNEIAEEALTQAAKDASEKAAMGFFEKIYTAYAAFINRFPEEYQWLVSLIVGVAVIWFLIKLIRKNWLWIVLAIILFPGILPILKNFFDSLTTLLVGKKLDE